MADAIDLARRAVGQVIWKDLHRLTREMLTNARRIREEKGEQDGATRR
jgi:hypothetical protein